MEDKLNMRCFKQKRGFNLIEMAMVMGVVALLFGTVWLGASSVQQNERIQRSITGVLIAAQNLNKQLPSSFVTASYIAIPSSYLINAKIFPDDWVQNNSLKNPWGLSVAVSGVIRSGQPLFQVHLRVPDIETCLKTSAAITGRFTDNTYLKGVDIGLVGVGPWTNYSVFPLSPSGTHCNGINGVIELAFQFSFGIVN